MMIYRRSHQFRTSPLDIDRLESTLQSTLRPVQPRPEFVGELRRQLSSQGFSMLSQPGLPPLHFLALLSISLFSALFIVAISVRTVVMLISAIGMWQQLRRQ